MCGIAGIWHPDPRPIDAAALRRMVCALVHRGPDEEGFHQAPGIGLGHRRLSIIDLATGQQPLSNEDGTVWIAFNGEIFNYLELRELLEQRGHRFRTLSDTETIVHLYEEYGLDFVDHLNGQFAIALWDGVRRRLVLVRDRVGIRPLFYSTLPDGSVVFGSEAKAIFAHGAVRPDLDPVALGQIVTLWVTVPPRTAFRHVRELAPATMLVVEPGRQTERRYWRHEFPRVHEYDDKPLEHWTEELRQVLTDAVRLQLRADVPIVTYLSGGLDSSILTALAQRHHAGDLTTFSVGFRDTRFDERPYQRAVVDHLGIDHRHLEVEAGDIGDAFPEVVWFSERPMMRTAPAPLLALAGLVRESGIKVVLTGEGADELFAGYNIFREDKIRRFCALQPGSARRARLFSRLYGYVERDPKTAAFWERFFQRDLANTSDPYYSHQIRWSNSAHMTRLFAQDMQRQMQSTEELLDELDAYLQPERMSWHPLSRAQYLEMTLFMSGYLLSSQGDRMMMGRSVEGRVPFLDHRVIELAARIPPKYKLRGLNEKYILKKAFEDLLPATIVQRPKQPYRAPIAGCFSEARPNLGRSLLSTEALAAAGLTDVPAVSRLVSKMSADGGRMSEREEMGVALVTSLQLLHHQFVEQAGHAAAVDRPLRSEGHSAELSNPCSH